ncbi:hypothetical protein ACFL6D_02300 [Spirochaetota bacterium]
MKKLIVFFFSFILFIKLAAYEIYEMPDIQGDIIPRDRAIDELMEEYYYFYGINPDESTLLLGIDTAEKYPKFKAVLLDWIIKNYKEDPQLAFYTDYFQYNLTMKKTLFKISDIKGEQEGDQKAKLDITFDQWETHMQLFGYQALSLSYGTGFYIRRLDQEATKLSNTYHYAVLWDVNRIGRIGSSFAEATIPEGFRAAQSLQINLKGTIGRKIEVSVSHHSRSSENAYSVQYKGDPDEFVKSVKMGDVNLNLGGKSRFVTVGGSTKEAFGIRAEGGQKNGPFNMTAILSLTKGVPAVKRIEGKRSRSTIRDTEYEKNRFFYISNNNIITWEYYITCLPEQNPDLLLLNIISLKTNYFLKQEIDFYNTVEGIIDLGRSDPVPLSRSILFYVYNDFGTNRGPSDMFATNYFPDWKIIEPSPASISNKILYSNFIIILNGSERSPYELRNFYRIPQRMDPQSISGIMRNREGDQVLSTVWYGESEFEWQTLGKMYMLIDKDVIYFSYTKPFSLMTDYKGFYEKNTIDYTAQNEYHAYYMEIEYEERVSGRKVDLHWNVIPGSVVVRRNETILPPSEYSVDYVSGKLQLNRELQKGETLEVNYEYKPFGTALQRTLVAGRVDYQIRDNSYIGSTIAYSSAQRPIGAPDPNSAPNSQFVMDVDGNLELFSFLRRRASKDFTLNISGEYAFSVYNHNTVGKAIINDMEGDDITYRLPESTYRYYYSVNPDLEGNRILGKSYFRDFTRYKTIDQFPEPLPFTIKTEIEMKDKTEDDGILGFKRTDVNIRPFEAKPGPYRVRDEGYLDKDDYRNQTVMVFDYDFTDITNTTADGGYVSYTIPVSGRTGKDFTRFNLIEIICKLVPTGDEDSTGSYIDPGVIGVSIDAGELNEDFDLDGIFDEEQTATDKDTMKFNYINNAFGTTISNFTSHGNGIQGWGSPEIIGEGNGMIDTEDINENGALNDLDSYFTYPSFETTGINLSNNLFMVFSTDYRSSSNITLGYNESTNIDAANYILLSNYNKLEEKDAIQDEHYIKITIPLNRTYATSVQNRLERVKALRLNLIQLDKKHARGRLVIDTLTFKGIRWTKVYVDKVEVQKAHQFKVSTIETTLDQYYKQNHIARSYRKTYEKLHGTLLADEYAKLKEQSLQMQYDLNGIPLTNTTNYIDGREGMVEKYLVQNVASGKPYDLSIYKRLKFYLFIKDMSDGGKEKFYMRLGESDRNYYEFKIPLSNVIEDDAVADNWYEMGIKILPLNDDEKEEIDKYADRDHEFLVEKKGVPISADGNRENNKQYKIENLPLDAYTLKRLGKVTLRRISYLAVGIVNEEEDAVHRRGEVWFNEVFLDKTKKQIGYAYRLDMGFSSSKDLSIFDFPLVSGFRCGLSTSKKGYYFTSIGANANTSLSESANYNAGSKLFNMFDLSYNRASSYNISEIDESLLPKDLQTLSTRDSHTLTIGLKLPFKFATHLPSFSHSVTKSVSSSFRFVMVQVNFQDFVVMFDCLFVFIEKLIHFGDLEMHIHLSKLFCKTAPFQYLGKMEE